MSERKINDLKTMQNVLYQSKEAQMDCTPISVEDICLKCPYFIEAKKKEDCDHSYLIMEITEIGLVLKCGFCNDYKVDLYDL